MKYLFSPFCIKNRAGLWLLIMMLWAFPQRVVCQEIEHTFKITGANVQEKVPKIIRNHLTLVNVVAQYDSLSNNHLYISDFNLDNLPLDKTCFLFEGKKFNLRDLDNYIDKEQLVKDGIQIIYGQNGLAENQMIFKEGFLQQQTSFFSNGKKHMMVSGDNDFLNGAFKIWHPNGQLSFSGVYKDNQKDGLFESFDASGNLEKKGLYKQGQLTEGEAVVQDFLYDSPQVPAQYKGNDSILNKILLKKTSNLIDIRALDSSVHRVLDLRLTIDKIGQVKKVDITNSPTPLEVEIIQAVFQKPFMDFQPALIEGVPVSSYFNKSFYLSNKGLQALIPARYQKSSYVYGACTDAFGPHVEVMPAFPGGEKALVKYLSHTLKYPAEATRHKIQGKVFVQFVILEDGSISDISIFKSVHPVLDAEAYRVIKAMPKWMAGQQDGKAVKVQYTMPINFVMQ